MFIAANWKMNLNRKEAENLAIEFINLDTPKNEVVIFPPFHHLQAISEVLENSKIKIGAQNCHSEDEGAFTGEISAKTLKDYNCEYVILGHSERRHIFNETSEDVRNKAIRANKNSLIPVICIGETLQDREDGNTNSILSKQINESLPKNFKSEDYIIAYEPVWAIGTGKVAEIEDIEAAHKHIAKEIGDDVKVIYGGSVNDSNCKQIAQINSVDGLLVGGASLSASKFGPIINV